MRRWTLIASAVIAMVASASATATTTPGVSLKLPVIITDSSISIANNSSMQRGVIVTFVAVNKGKKTHNFSLMGHTTRALKPGAHGFFTIDLQHRGAWTYKSTYGPDKSNKKLTGFFTVY
jgi:hypothetical protein